MTEKEPEERRPAFYCPKCGKPVTRPLVCGDCSAIICRDCGTPLETEDELSMG